MPIPGARPRRESAASARLLVTRARIVRMAYWNSCKRIVYSSRCPDLGVESSKETGTHMALVSYVLATLRRDEEGQGLAEYALILALIAIVAIVALIFLGNQVSTILSTVGSSV
jgi:pilus assembly protein Flp/PilA